MRISDWSSDVCSSDLAGGAEIGLQPPPAHLALAGKRRVHLADGAVRAARQQPLAGALDAGGDLEVLRRVADIEQVPAVDGRSEERRGGQECDSTCRYRWST